MLICIPFPSDIVTSVIIIEALMKRSNSACQLLPIKMFCCKMKSLNRNNKSKHVPRTNHVV